MAARRARRRRRARALLGRQARRAPRRPATLARAQAGDRQRRPQPAPAGSRRARRWACARRGSAAPRRPPARTRRPARATSGRRRRGATSTAPSASTAAAVECPLGNEAALMCVRPTRTCGCGEQRLEQLGAQRRERHDHGDRQRYARTVAGERDQHQRDAPDREQRRVEQVRQVFGDAADAPRTSSATKWPSSDGVFGVRRRHERGDAHTAQRDQAQPGQQQRAGGTGPATLVLARHGAHRARHRWRGRVGVAGHVRRQTTTGAKARLKLGQARQRRKARRAGDQDTGKVLPASAISACAVTHTGVCALVRE